MQVDDPVAPTVAGRPVQVAARVPARDRLVRAGRVVAGSIAVADLLLLAFVLVTGRFLLRAGPLRLRTNDYVGFATASLAIWAVFVALAWTRPRLRRGALAGLAVAACCSLIVVAQHAPSLLPVGDAAVIELYTLLATHGQILVGPYSRFIWHHPGPLYFLTAAPFYIASGSQTPGIHAAAVAINVASVAGIVWVACRLGSATLAVALAGALTLYVARARELLVSIWNPHVATLPAMALLLVCAAVASGDVALLPLAALLATFVAQTHVGFVPFAVVMSAVAVAGAIASSRSAGRGGRVRLPRSVNVTLWVSAALWLLPVSEELTRSPGNLTRLWQFFVLDRRGGQPFGLSFRAWADSLAAWSAPEFHVAWGARFVPSVAIWPVAWCLVQVVGAAAVSVWAARTGRRFLAVTAGLLAGASGVALWSVTHIEGEIVDHEVFWLSALGVLTAAVMCAGVADAVSSRAGIRPRFPRGVVAAACSVPIALAIVFGIRDLAPDSFPFDRRVEDTRARALGDGAAAYLRDNGVRKPLLRMDFRTWAMTAGVALQLQRAGRPFAVESGAVPIFSDAFAATGDEDAEITISVTPRHLELETRPGNHVVASYDRYFADAVRIEPNRNR